jgi:hypothetical protein
VLRLAVLLRLLNKLSLLLSKPLRLLNALHLLPVDPKLDALLKLPSKPKRRLNALPKLLVKLAKLLNKRPRLNVCKYNKYNNNHCILAIKMHYK